MKRARVGVAGEEKPVAFVNDDTYVDLWLQPGDVMELEIDGLGSQRQTVLAPR